MLLGWLIPGSGHLMQGRVARGLVAFVLVVGLFALGTMLAEGTNLDRTRHFYYWAGQTFLGPIVFGAELANGHPVMTERPEYADAGVMLASIAGMLNVMLLLDVYRLQRRQALRPAAVHRGSRGGAKEGRAMNDLGLHVGLFLLVIAVVVAVNCMFTEADDARALRLFPRQYATFVVVSAVVVVVMLVAEHTFASVS